MFHIQDSEHEYCTQYSVAVWGRGRGCTLYSTSEWKAHSHCDLLAARRPHPLGLSSALPWSHLGLTWASAGPQLCLTLVSPCPHLGLTLSSPGPHLGLTWASPRSHLGLTWTSPRSHLVLTWASPWSHHAHPSLLLLFGKYYLVDGLKWQCHEIFYHLFISFIQPIWAPDKQVKMVFLKNSLSQRYSNFKFKFNKHCAEANFLTIDNYADDFQYR